MISNKDIRGAIWINDVLKLGGAIPDNMHVKTGSNLIPVTPVNKKMFVSKTVTSDRFRQFKNRSLQ